MSYGTIPRDSTPLDTHIINKQTAVRSTKKFGGIDLYMHAHRPQNKSLAHLVNLESVHISQQTGMHTVD